MKNNSYTDRRCVETFVAYMNYKAAQYGMNNTFYANASGLTVDSFTTPRDALILGLRAASDTRAPDIWATPDRAFSVNGKNARSLNVSNNVISLFGVSLENAGYRFLGGKGGRLTRAGYDRACILLAEIHEKTIVMSLMARGKEPFDNIDKSAVELCNVMAASSAGEAPAAGPNLTELVSLGGGYAACEVSSEDHSVLVSPSVKRRPASTTKLMTMLCALDFIQDEQASLTVKASDISSGSGSAFLDGDVLSWHDALRIMMMESSNTLANTIARESGAVILSDKSVRIPLKYLLKVRILRNRDRMRKRRWYKLLGKIKSFVSQL